MQSIEYAIHIHDRSLLMRVKSEWHIQKAKPYFSKKCEQLLKYGLHWDAVISRWAREHANEVGALEVLQMPLKYYKKCAFSMHFVFNPRKFSDFMGLFLLNSKKYCKFL